MNVGSVPFPSIGYAITLSQSGRMSVPVSPSSYIYSHFKHVSGVPATDGENGVSINRLKIIDTLIEQISRMKKEPEPELALSLDMQEQENDIRINELIDQYHSQVRNLQAASAQNPYFLAAPQTGALFNISI